MTLRYSKLHGLGNDFFVVDCRTLQSLDFPTPALARRVCDRHTGESVATSTGPVVGADGILRVHNAQDSRAYARMEILNADGSTAEMCGNGIRVVALFLRMHDGAQLPRAFQIETLAGMIGVSTQGEYDFEVDMGVPRIGERGLQLEAGGGRYVLTTVDMGNPHAVIFEGTNDPQASDAGFTDLDALDLRAVGEPIELHPAFPHRTNVEFVRVESRDHLRVRVWERGSGETLACGTGACAAAVVALERGLVVNPVRVTLPGGDLQIAWAGAPAGTGARGGKAESVFMTGPAEFTGDGEFTR